MSDRRSWVVGLVCLVGVGLLPAWAETPSPAGGRQDRVDEMMGRYNLYPAFEKLGRGLSNALLGWLELPLGVHRHYTKADTGPSFLTGAAHGVVKGVVRTGVGFYETLTFFLPYPENFAPILPTLPYFRKAHRREPLPLE